MHPKQTLDRLVLLGEVAAHGPIARGGKVVRQLQDRGVRIAVQQPVVPFLQGVVDGGVLQMREEDLPVPEERHPHDVAVGFGDLLVFLDDEQLVEGFPFRHHVPLEREHVRQTVFAVLGDDVVGQQFLLHRKAR